jgi:hypothetical protein
MPRIVWILLFRKIWRKKRGKKMATLRAVARWAVLSSLLAAMLFITAGSTAIPSLRDYVRVFSALLLFTMVAVDPELARERALPAGTDIDPGSRTASRFLFLATVIFAAPSCA